MRFKNESMILLNFIKYDKRQNNESLAKHLQSALLYIFATTQKV